MSKPVAQERRIKNALYAIIISICSLYVGQIFIYKYRFYAISAEKTQYSMLSETCEGKNCIAEFKIEPKHKFLLLGHVMRYHILKSQDTGLEIHPISAVRGVANESWMGLRVYPVEPNAVYILTATKPKAVKMGYFIGILPRTTDHEGVLSIPDISPTVSTMTTMAGFGVLGVLLFAAFLAPQSGANGLKKRDELMTIAVSALAAAIVSAITSGVVDSLMPDGELRSRILRTCAIFAMLAPVLLKIVPATKNQGAKSIFISMTVSVVAVNFLWEFFRAGVTWIVSYTAILVSLSVNLWRRGYRFAAIISMFAIWDPITMAGFTPIADFPPIKLFNIGLVGVFSLITSQLGAITVLSLASRAYQRFTRDIMLSKITNILDESTQENSSLQNQIKRSLPPIAQLTGAGRVSILINLPFARPITHTYAATQDSFVTHDDGKIPGEVSIRAFVYGDEAWFERYEDFSKRLQLSRAHHLNTADYICISPIRVQGNILGVLMLTCFQDDFVESQIKSGQISNEKETAKMIVASLSSAFSDIVIKQMKSTNELSGLLLSKIREAIPASNSIEEFFTNYCHAVYDVSSMRVLLHKKIESQGVLICHFGLETADWQMFHNAPFNLHATAVQAVGSTVVAFKEQKPSYLKDWSEIEDKLHERTREILKKVNAKTIAAIPLKSGNDLYVLTLVSHSSQPPVDSGVASIVEGTEAIFDAAVTVFNQRASVLALGRLANRLIGDDDVRDQIINAAKQNTLPTTIGAARSSFLLLIDLAGSSNLPDDTEDKASAYGKFYDEVNKLSQHHLSGKVRKTIGDAIIITWDGSTTMFEDIEDPLPRLIHVVGEANEVAVKIGCTGVRAVLHYGNYFFGLIGTSSFGQIDVIGRGIDEVCKIETQMKTKRDLNSPLFIAVSESATEKLISLTPNDWQISGLIAPDQTNSQFDSTYKISWIAFRSVLTKNRIGIEQPPSQWSA